MTALEALARMSDEELYQAIADKVVSALKAEKERTTPQPELKAVAEYLTKKETAQLLKVSTKTVERWERKGVMPCALKINGCMRWEKSAVLNRLSTN